MRIFLILVSISFVAAPATATEIISVDKDAVLLTDFATRGTVFHRADGTFMFRLEEATIDPACSVMVGKIFLGVKLQPLMDGTPVFEVRKQLGIIKGVQCDPTQTVALN